MYTALSIHRCLAYVGERLRPNRLFHRSKYKGVRWDRRMRKWRAEIRCNGRKIHVGYFDYEADAAIAYDDRAIELFGEFAWLNHHNRPEIRLWLNDKGLV